MALGGGWWPSCLPVIACLLAAPSRSQDCSVERMDDTIIDVNLALSRGVRAAEPLYASSPGACGRACCLGKALPGDKKCNLMIFDARRTSTHPNCYLFYCPSAAACPTKPAMGLVSYKISRDIQAPEDTSFKSGYSLSFRAGDFTSRSPTSHLNHTTALQQSDFHPTPELPNHVAKQVDRSEFHTDSLKIQDQEHPESLASIPRLKVNNLLPPKASFAAGNGNPSASVPMTQPSVPEAGDATAAPLPTGVPRLPSSTRSLPTAAKPAAPTTTTTTVAFLPSAEPGSPAARTAAARVPLSSSRTTTTTAKWVTTNSSARPSRRGPDTPWTPAAVSSSDTNHVTLLSSDLTLPSNESLGAFQNTPQGFEPSDSRSYFLEGLLRRENVIRLGEKSGLVAALFLGLIFLLLVIALTGKKVHESLHKRRYTRLDYLINGMYADV